MLKKHTRIIWERGRKNKDAPKKNHSAVIQKNLWEVAE